MNSWEPLRTLNIIHNNAEPDTKTSSSERLSVRGWARGPRSEKGDI